MTLEALMAREQTTAHSSSPTRNKKGVENSQNGEGSTYLGPPPKQYVSWLYWQFVTVYSALRKPEITQSWKQFVTELSDPQSNATEVSGKAHSEVNEFYVEGERAE